MPRLIEDIVEVKPDDVEVLEPEELEWTKDAEGVYHHDHFRIVPSGGKFALEVVEGKGKKAKATQACRGPLKICKGFALDISEGRLVKLESGNWGSPPPVEPILGKALTNKQINDIYAERGEKQRAYEASQNPPTLPPVASIRPEPLIPVATSIHGLSEAIALLSRQHLISCLPPGSHFSQGGRFGTFVEMVGMDAKVEWEGKTIIWSGASPVKWAAERPIKSEVKAPKQVTAPSVEGDAPSIPAMLKTRPQQADKSIFGHHVKRVIMAMAVAAFTEVEIALAVKAHNMEVSPARIALLSKRAIRSEDGEPAPLTPDQLKQLKNIVGKK